MTRPSKAAAPGSGFRAAFIEHKHDLKPTKELGKGKSVREMDQDKRLGSQQDDSSVEVSESQVKKLKPHEAP